MSFNAKTPTTSKGLFLGKVDAESESVSTDINFGGLYEDYFDSEKKINSGSFLIVGRKGSGKTAVGEHLFHKHDKYRCVKFIKGNEIAYEVINKQLSADQSIADYVSVVEWTLLIKICEALISIENLKQNPSIKTIKAFLRNNDAFVSLGEHQIKEHITKHGLAVSFSALRGLAISMGDEITIKGERAPFHKVIPDLKRIVFNLLSLEQVKSNYIIVIFDDLDVGFKANSESQKQQICALIRMIKSYTTEFLRRSISCRAVIMLRDDIKKEIKTYDTDMSKTFVDSEINLKWYEIDAAHTNENETKLKKFINKRITTAYEKLGYKEIPKNAWGTLVSDEVGINTSSFKFMSDYTHFRPRDFLLMFSKLGASPEKLPLSFERVKSILRTYTNEFSDEIHSEMSIYFSQSEINSIFSKLRTIFSNNSRPSREYLFQQFESTLKNQDPNLIVDTLYKYSVIGIQETRKDGLRTRYHYRSDEVNPLYDNSTTYSLHRIFEFNFY